ANALVALQRRLGVREAPAQPGHADAEVDDARDHRRLAGDRLRRFVLLFLDDALALLGDLRLFLVVVFLVVPLFFCLRVLVHLDRTAARLGGAVGRRRGGLRFQQLFFAGIIVVARRARLRPLLGRPQPAHARRGSRVRRG